MENFNISTAELLSVLAAMNVAADAYETESNRTTLGDIRRTLSRRAKNTRAIASNLKNRALNSGPEFCKEWRASDLS